MISSPLEKFYEIVCVDLPKLGEITKSLEDHLAYQKKKVPFLNEPWLVKKCCSFLIQNGLDSEGIFRVSGSAVTIKKLISLFEGGINPDFKSEAVLIEDVASVLKYYLRQLANPIFCGDKSGDEIECNVIALLDLQEGSYEQISRLKQIVKSLSHVKKVLLYDLFSLFVNVVKHEDVNKMGIANLGTIFAGMNSIFVSNCQSSKRIVLFEIMIKYFDFIFCDTLSLEWSQVNYKPKNASRWLKVYLDDGSYKYFQSAEDENATSTISKVIKKISGSSSVDVGNHKLYQVQDIFYREIGHDEYIVDLVERGNAILFTSLLVGQLLTFPIDNTNEKFLQMQSLAANDSNNANLTIQRDGSNSSLSVKNFSNTSEEEDNKFPVWVIQNVPRDSKAAIKWDIATAVEGRLEVKLESILELTFASKKLSFSFTEIVPMNDTTRFFLLINKKLHVGVGFEQRKTSFKFKECMYNMQNFRNNEMTQKSSASAPQKLNVNVPQKPDINTPQKPDINVPQKPDINAPQKPDVSTPSQQPNNDTLQNAETSTSDVKEDVPSANQIPSESAVDTSPIKWVIINEIASGFVENINKHKVVVDFQADTALEELMQLWKKISPNIKSNSLKSQMLAIIVSNASGGPDLYSYAGMESLQTRFDNFLSNSKLEENIPLGKLKCSTSFCRCLLFKVLADQSNLKTIIMHSSDELKLHSYVGAFINPLKLSIVDLVINPGLILDSDSPIFKKIVSEFESSQGE